MKLNIKLQKIYIINKLIKTLIINILILVDFIVLIIYLMSSTNEI